MKIFNNKSCLLKVILFPSLVLTLASAHAATVSETALLKVTGKITPASCSLILGADSAMAGEINYGNVSSKVGNQAQFSGHSTNLDTLTLSNAVTVNCEGPTLIGINTVDNRASSSVNYTNNSSSYFSGERTLWRYNLDGSAGGDATHFLGLGADSKGVPIGSYSGTFVKLKVDGADARFSTCMSETVHTGATIEQQGALVVADCPAGQSHQILDTSNNVTTGSTFVWDYYVDAATESAADLDPNGWDLDGSVTVQINYL